MLVASIIVSLLFVYIFIKEWHEVIAGTQKCVFIGISSWKGMIVRDNFILVNRKSLRIIGFYKYLIYVLICDNRLLGLGSESESKRERKRDISLLLCLTRTHDKLSDGMLSLELT